LIEIRSLITRKLKFSGQLGVKLKDSAAKDHFAEDDQLWGLNWFKPGWNWKNWKFNDQLGVKLHKSETKDQSAKDV